jgi:hypothetical protein
LKSVVWPRARRGFRSFARLATQSGDAAFLHASEELFGEAAPRYKSFQWKSAFESTCLFSPLETAEFTHAQTIPAEAIEDRVASISFIAALPDSTRAVVLEQVRETVCTDPAIRGRKQIDFPYRTDVFWCRTIS